MYLEGSGSDEKRERDGRIDSKTDHFGSRMKNLHLFQDGSSIIGDSHISIGCLDLKVQWNPYLLTL